MGEKRNAYWFRCGMRLLGTLWHRRKDNIEMELKSIGWGLWSGII
jgi:hypothetical protein